MDIDSRRHVTGDLTGRENQILRYVVVGESNKRIGYALGITEKTVKNHMTAILRKMGSREPNTGSSMCAQAPMDFYQRRLSRTGIVR